MTKAVGGRGKKAENKYERLTITLHPDVLQLLKGHAEHSQITTSEMVSKMVGRYEKLWPLGGRKN